MTTVDSVEALRGRIRGLPEHTRERYLRDLAAVDHLPAGSRDVALQRLSWRVLRAESFIGTMQTRAA